MIDRLWLFALACVALIAGGAPAAEKLVYNRDVRPILSNHCFRCHGPDSGERKAKMRLDQRESAIDKGAIVPGKPDESELVARIFADDETIMPPAAMHKPLAPTQKEILKRWIAEGAEYQPHWAYIAPIRPQATKQSAWIRNPVDAFVLAELSAKGIQPSREADRRTLLRRLSLDLVGLPPTPAEVEAFVKDHDPKAYEKQVERLLASPHYGERMAAPWLDVARFADTVGYHGDQNVNVFPYRDYVINAFNSNKPFDVFTREQLAGDLLPNRTTEQLVATGFNRLNMMTREGGAQPNEYLAKYAADRVRTVSTAWLGSTMGCCECHDHKFDPFSTKDFYSLSAFFADVKQWGVYQNYEYTPNPDLKGFTNEHPFPPEIKVDSPYLQRRVERLRNELNALFSATAAAHRGAFDNWKVTALKQLERHPDGWIVPKVALASEKDDRLQLLDDGRVLVTKKVAKGDQFKVRLDAPAERIAALRLELLPHAKHKGTIVRSGSATTVVLIANLVRPGEKPTKLAFYHADADRKDERYANGFAILGVSDGWRTASAAVKQKQSAIYLLDAPIEFKAGDTIDVNVRSDSVGCFRVSLSPFAPADPRRGLDVDELKKVLAGDKVTPAVAGAWLRSTAADRVAFSKYEALYRELREYRDGKADTVVTQHWAPKPVRVLPRGNWQDESGEVVSPAVPHFLPQPAKNGPLTRLDFANWLVAPENPLTARTFANRLWKQFFGTGLSAVLDDLGAQGEWPTHPELLDWLAVEFRESGWDVKHLVRQIVLSSTYRQDSKARPELRDLDPANRLLAYHTPRRLEAEIVRDNALAIAGLLDPEVGGPSAKPYQPGGYYANLQFPDRVYQTDRDDRQYRRGIYSHWQRTFLHPMLANFDAPSREETCACRHNANTPQQALTLLNDPTFVEASRVLAAKLLAEKATDGQMIDRVFRRVLARSPKAAESESLTRFLGQQREYFRSRPEESAKLLHIGNAAAVSGNQTELAAWASVCRVVLNLHETITRY